MQYAWRWARTALGYSCLVLGVAGLFLPFLQGVLLLAVGLSILSVDSPWARRYHDRLRGWIARRRDLPGKGTGDG